ncbi:MAG: hypothetical protein R2748_26120 [Bryobacterales bacterium]
MIRILPILLLAVGVAHAADFEAWVRAQNGAVERRADGRIVAVDLSHSWVTDADLGRIAELGSLDRLDFSGTRITDVGLEWLKPLTGVRELKLRFAEFVSEGGLAYLRSWNELQSLDLRGTQVRSQVFEILPAFPRLRRLDLSHTRITDEGFDRLAELEELEDLAIGSTRLEGAALDYLKQAPHLRTLDLSGVQRVDSGIWGIALNLSNLRRIGELTALERLDLSGATITDVGSDRPGRPDAERTSLPGLEALAGLKRLRELDLSRQPVTGPDLRFLIELPELRVLRLGQCVDIDDDAAAVLAQLPLEELYIAGTAISAPGLAILGQSDSLIQLAVGGTDVTEADATAFRRSHPRVHLDWFPPQFPRERRTAQ